MGEETQKDKSHHRHRHRHDRDDDRHRHKKRRHDEEDPDRERRKHKHRHGKETSPPPKDTVSEEEKSLADQFDEDMWEERPQEPPPNTATSKEAETAPPTTKVERQAWMMGDPPNNDDNDKQDPFTSFLGGAAKQKKTTDPPKPQGLVLSSRELNTSLLDPPPPPPSAAPAAPEDKYIPPNYVIGDDGSSWRMMKLKNIYKASKETLRPVEDVALERLGSLQAFDEAREEEQELERRKRDFRGDGVKKVKLTGELWISRLEGEERRRKRKEDRKRREQELYPPQKASRVTASSTHTEPQNGSAALVTQTDLNKLQAELLRAEMTASPSLPKLQAQYSALVQTFNTQSHAPEIVLLPSSHSALLPHLSRETSKSETDLTIEDMVREERSTKRLQTVDRIARDRKYQDNLEYLDEHAEELAKQTKRKEVDLKSLSVQEYKKMQRVVEKCALCFKDGGMAPVAPVVSLATRVYLSLPTEPELTSDGAMIVPLRHAKNLADCDDDEWEEIRVHPSLPRIHFSLVLFFLVPLSLLLLSLISLCFFTFPSITFADPRTS